MASGVVEWVLRVVNGVSAPVAAASASTRKLTQDTAAASTQFSKLGAAFGPLGGILARVSPELGAVGASIAALTSASNTAAAGLGISSASMGVAFGVVAAAAASVYGVYRMLTHESELAADAEAFHALNAHNLDGALRRLEDATLKADLATGRLTQSQYDAEVGYQGVIRGAQDYAASISKQRTALEEGVESNQKWIDRLATATPIVAALTGVVIPLGAATEYLTDELDAGLRKLSELSVQEQEHTSILFAEADAAEEAAEATAKAAKAAAAKAAADRIGKEESAAQTKAIEEQTAAYQKWIDEYSKGKSDAYGEKIAAKGLDVVRDMAAEGERKRAEAVSQSEFELQLAQDRLDKEAWYAELKDRERMEAQARAMGALGAASSTGGVTSAIASSGPIGAIIVGVMEAITNLDSTLGGLGDFVADFRKSLADAPKEFADFLVKELGRGDKMIGAVIGFVQGLIDNAPRIMQALAGSVGDLVGALIEGLVEGVPQLVGSLLSSLFDPQTWVKAGEALVQGFVDGFGLDAPTAEAATKAAERNTSDPYGGVKGSHADGADYVDKTGLYIVHRGERIDTASRTQRDSGGSTSAGGSSGRMIGRGGKVYIEIDADSLSDTFDGLRGRGYSMGAR